MDSKEESESVGFWIDFAIAAALVGLALIV